MFADKSKWKAAGITAREKRQGANKALKLSGRRKDTVKLLVCTAECVYCHGKVNYSLSDIDVCNKSH